MLLEACRVVDLEDGVSLTLPLLYYMNYDVYALCGVMSDRSLVPIMLSCVYLVSDATTLRMCSPYDYHFATAVFTVLVDRRNETWFVVPLRLSFLVTGVPEDALMTFKARLRPRS